MVVRSNNALQVSSCVRRPLNTFRRTARHLTICARIRFALVNLSFALVPRVSRKTVANVVAGPSWAVWVGLAGAIHAWTRYDADGYSPVAMRTTRISRLETERGGRGRVWLPCQDAISQYSARWAAQHAYLDWHAFGVGWFNYHHQIFMLQCISCLCRDEFGRLIRCNRGKKFVIFYIWLVYIWELDSLFISNYGGKMPCSRVFHADLNFCFIQNQAQKNSDESVRQRQNITSIHCRGPKGDILVKSYSRLLGDPAFTHQIVCAIGVGLPCLSVHAAVLTWGRHWLHQSIGFVSLWAKQ